MYETEEELDRYFGNNKKRVFTVYDLWQQLNKTK